MPCAFAPLTEQQFGPPLLHLDVDSKQARGATTSLICITLSQTARCELEGHRFFPRVRKSRRSPHMKRWSDILPAALDPFCIHRPWTASFGYGAVRLTNPTSSPFGQLSMFARTHRAIHPSPPASSGADLCRVGWIQTQR